MNLGKKKKLAMRTLDIGESRIVFLKSRLEEIKDAITKQDIRDLVKSGAIIIKEKKGRRSVEREKSRSVGNVHQKAREKKREYIILTRKLRRYMKSLLSLGNISKENLAEIRKKIRNRDFKSISGIKEHIRGQGN
ncbi:MAG: 50S ribosomal protein L19e [Nanoarchaeota archaeon]